MISLTPPSRINHVAFVFGIVCLATILAGVIFVAAHSNDTELSATHVATSPVDVSTKAKIAERFGKLPLSFEINKGQTDKAVKFLSHGAGNNLFLTANEAVLSLRKPQAPAKDEFNSPTSTDAVPDAKVREGSGE